MITKRKTKPTRRIAVSGKIKPDVKQKLLEMAAEYGEPRISSFVSIILESYAKGHLIETSALRQNCAEQARKHMQRKLQQAREDNAPILYMAGVESMALEIETAILHESEHA